MNKQNLFKVLSTSAFVASAFAFSGTAHAIAINFDDLPNGTQVNNQYSALGATFSQTNWGVVGGMSEGDPGNWSLDGTNGPHFLGFNGSPSYMQSILWANQITGFSLDVSRSNGSSVNDSFTLIGLLNGSTVDSQTVSLTTINTWTTVKLVGTFNEIQWYGSGSDFHPYGVDNLVSSPVPVPAAAWLLGSGLLGLVGVARRKAA